MQDSTPAKKSYKQLSTLPGKGVDKLNRKFAYAQQSKLVNVAASIATGHVQLAKRNRAENLKRK